MESNSVCNHTSDFQNRTTAKWESDLLITRITTDRIGRQEGLLPINQNYDKIGERNWTSVIRFHKNEKQQFTLRNARQQRAHDAFCPFTQARTALTVPLTVLLHCPITSMTRTLPY